MAIADVIGKLSPSGYSASAWEWAGYAGGSLLVAGLVLTVIRSSDKDSESRKDKRKTPPLDNSTVNTVVSWDNIEQWIKSDKPAQQDLFDNRALANQVYSLIKDGTRSIGIVGPYGSGKTSVVSWVSQQLAETEHSSVRHVVCHHSCWGFETSAAAIHDMLSRAISRLGDEVDTFQVDSLPESYQQMFAVGGDLVSRISKLLLNTADPMKQFSRLSELLGSLGWRLVFIVEDIDRHETRNFETQEVLAFLERLKEYPNLQFIITGGLFSGRRIDFHKLCDRFLVVKSVQLAHSTRIIRAFSERCRDQSIFPHHRIPSQHLNYESNPLTDESSDTIEEYTLAQAIARLLATPRSLRHVLGSTYNTWRALHGEVDFNHLFSIKTLQHSAPECFNFIWERWYHLRSIPSGGEFFAERNERVRQAIVEDWKRTVQNAEWNPSAVMQVMKYVLPASEYWLVDKEYKGSVESGQQYISEERYWIRVVNESIGAEEVRDQEVIRDIQTWLKTSERSSALVQRLTTDPKYSLVWKSFARIFMGNSRDKILLISEQVITTLLERYRADACSHSQGFIDTWSFSSTYAPKNEDNKGWLQSRIEEAASTSIEMVNALWQFYGHPGSGSIIQFEEASALRQYTIDTIRRFLAEEGSSPVHLCSERSLARESESFHFGTCFAPLNRRLLGRRIISKAARKCPKKLSRKKLELGWSFWPTLGVPK